jgi:Aconitase family (aconitate hydratase)
MRVNFEGKLGYGVTAKDLILVLIGRIGAAGGTGHAVEYAGSAIRDGEASGMMVAVVVLMLVGVILSAMIWRLQAYLLRWQRPNVVE